MSKSKIIKELFDKLTPEEIADSYVLPSTKSKKEQAKDAKAVSEYIKSKRAR